MIELSNITALWLESRLGIPGVKTFLAYPAEIFLSPAPRRISRHLR
jgi:hypothetical protein